MSSRLSIPKDWVKPLIIEPCRQHKQTLIILHGRGDSGEDFAPAILRMPLRLISPKPEQITQFSSPKVSLSGSTTSSTEHLRKPSSQPDKLPSPITIRDALPHTKFVFLTAPMRACTMLNGAENRQWFDNFSLINPERRQDLQRVGLRETVDVVHQLIHNEIQDSESLGKTIQIALMGFSQGAAASLISGLVWNTKIGKKILVAVVSMSGWLPFRGLLEGTEDQEKYKTVSTRLEHLRQTLHVDQVQRNDDGDNKNAEITTASFLFCHGKDDQHVDLNLSRMAASTLHDLGIGDVKSREYSGLAHSVNSLEIGDAVEFLQKKFGETNRV